jgi:hypothetical protein
MTRRQPEAAIQRAVFEHFKIRSSPGAFAFHVPNGGWRSPIEAKILKSLGVTAGVPDIIIIRDSRTYGLELKAKGGKLTPQIAAHSLLVSAGAMVAVADNIDAALSQLESWKLLRGETN